MEINKNIKKVKKVVEVDETTYTLELTKDELCTLASLSGYICGKNKFREITNQIYYAVKNMTKTPSNFSQLFQEDIKYLSFNENDLVETAKKISEALE